MSRQKVEARPITPVKDGDTSSYDKVSQTLSKAGSPPIKIVKDEPETGLDCEPNITYYHRPEEFEKALAIHEALKNIPEPKEVKTVSAHAQSPVLPEATCTSSEDKDEVGLQFRMDF